MDPLRFRSRRISSAPSSPEARERARALILEYGWNSTCYQILNPGLTLWFSASRPAVVGYAEHAGVRVVAGAPVCPGGDLPEVAAEFERAAARAGAQVCYFAAESRLTDARDSARVLLGAQPVWTPRSWPQILARHASLRAQVARARNKGVVVVEQPTDLAHQLEIARCLGEWLSRRGLPPLHFLVEPETLGALTDRRLFVARCRGALVGFLILSPVPRRHGWLVEQIVRGAAAPNGTAEAMIDAALRPLAAEGFAYVTLGLAPLSRRSPFSLEQNPLWLRLVLDGVRTWGRRYYNFDGLDAFKAKLHPDAWEPVYAVANRPRFSPRLLWAIAAAFSGGSPWSLGWRALRRRRGASR